MGEEIVVDIELENPGDRALFERGFGDESDIRRSTVEALVDTGAVMSMLPRNVVERIGVNVHGTAIVTYADERQEERPIAGPLTLRVCNRLMSTDCIVGPPLSEPLVGQIVLEALDLDRRLPEPHPDPAPRVTGLSRAQAQVAPPLVEARSVSLGDVARSGFPAERHRTAHTGRAGRAGMRLRSRAWRASHSCSGASDFEQVDLPGAGLGRDRHAVAERDPGGRAGGNPFAEADDAGKVQRIHRAHRHQRAVRRCAADPPQGLDRFGQGKLLAGDAGHEPPPADLAARLQAAELAQQVAPRHGERLACEERLERHAVTPQQGTRDGLDTALDRSRIGRAARHAGPPAGLGDGAQAARGGAGECPQPREPVRAHESVRDQLADGGGRVRCARAGLVEDVVEERCAAGLQAREDARGTEGE